MGRLYRALPLAMLGFSLAAPVAAQTRQAGVASVAVGDPLGKSPEQAERVLRIGVDVFAGERISTKVDDRAHLVFLDGSALTIGPNTDLAIERFTYDPNKRDGDLAINVSRGAFRFVGGAIGKKRDVTVQTPSATIALRGGIMTVSVGADSSTTVGFLAGRSAQVANPFGTSAAYRAGSQIVVPYNGPPSSPVALPPGVIQTFIASIDPAPGTTQPGDQQSLDARARALNTQAGLPPSGAGEQAFINFMNGSAQQSANAVNQANVLIASGQATPISVSSPSAGRSATPAIPAISGGSPIVPGIAALPVKVPVPVLAAGPPAAAPSGSSSGAIFTLSNSGGFTMPGGGGTTIISNAVLGAARR
jgi:hypothetical protein